MRGETGEKYKLSMSSLRKPTNGKLKLSDDDLHFSNVHGGINLNRRHTILTIIARNSAMSLFALCTLINVLVLVLISNKRFSETALFHFHQEAKANLQRPSQFIRFDEIQRSSPPVPRQFNNHPILIAQIDTNDPTRVLGEVKRPSSTHLGTYNFEERRVLVNSHISTIVQFRAIDYGMELCELRLVIPPFIMNGSNPGLLDRTQSRPLSLYRLNSTLLLDARGLSLDSRPERVAKVAEVFLMPEGETDGLVWHRKFYCDEEEILTFELTCGSSAIGDSCNVEWWQDAEGTNPAIFFSQYSNF